MPNVLSHLSLSSGISADSGKDKEVIGEGREDSKAKTTQRRWFGSSSLTNFVNRCSTCSDAIPGSNFCSQCSSFSLRCGICQEGIRGAAVYCPGCCHGGHIDHMHQWFGEMDEAFCPTGCGCECSIFLKPLEEELDTAIHDSDDFSSDHSQSSGGIFRNYSSSSLGFLDSTDDFDRSHYRSSISTSQGLSR